MTKLENMLDWVRSFLTENVTTNIVQQVAEGFLPITGYNVKEGRVCNEDT